MDGTILHYDAAQEAGLIRAGDGKRYAFGAGDWKLADPPAPGDAVDFEIEDDKAIEVYRVRAAPTAVEAPAPAPATPPPSAPGPGVGPYLAERPGLVFAGVVLLGCFLPFVSLGIVSPNLFSVIGFTSMASNFGYATPAGVQIGLLLYYLLYAVPGLAGWLIFQELRGEASSGLRTRVGIICLAGPFLVVVLSGLLLQSAIGGSPFSGYGGGYGGYRGLRGGNLGLSIVSSISFGWILIAAASIALIAVGAGWSPFGRRED